MSCASDRSRTEASLEEYSGDYGTFIGHIGELHLSDTGSYECFVTNGSVDGCLTVVGSGTSKGTWLPGEGAVAFFPEFESRRLVLSFEGARAVLGEGGLVLRVGEFEYVLPKLSTPEEQAGLLFGKDRASHDR